ncbi:response regulator [Prosthecomicrobium sp. N25]|uniref:response regulator n=1 Tax=Prosthecomicrobium sp. N25 TaxID=3129254 RepID=UPI0030774BFF
MPTHLDFSAYRVLVMDDNRNFQNMLRTMLRTFGFRRVDVLSEAAKVLLHLEQNAIDLVFLDLVMTGTGGSRESGLDLIDDIRHDGSLANPMMPIVLVTGHASRPVVERAMSSGADYVLAKPVSPRTVQAAVTAMLGRNLGYVRGRNGYFGPDLEAVRRRLKGVADVSLRRRKGPAPGPAQPVRTQLPGMNVPRRMDDVSFLD